MHQIAVISGDGIGPEVIAAGRAVLDATAQKCGFQIGYTDFSWGADYYLKTGKPLPPNGLDELRKFSAIYLGAIGDPRVPPGILERAIVGGVRWDLDLYVNLRPMKLYNERY